MPPSSPTVALLAGRETAFPQRFLDAVTARGVRAEFARLGGTRAGEPVPYAVIVDRVSHEAPYYRTYLKHAALAGVAVVNDPFRWSADDKFAQAAVAAKVGVPHPRTVVLPNKDYLPGVVPAETLRNLVYPLDWAGIADHVGLPCVLKDVYGGGWGGAYVCHSVDELVRNYDSSGLLTMVAQEQVRWNSYVRAVCVGGAEVLAVPYDPLHRRYLPDASGPEPEYAAAITDHTAKLCRALGYDLNLVEWAVAAGGPVLIDALNPAPDLDALPPAALDWVVDRLARFVVERAK